MYILICSFVNGDVHYVGPFPTIQRANKYVRDGYEGHERKPSRWHVRPLIIPGSVISRVVLRGV